MKLTTKCSHCLVTIEFKKQDITKKREKKDYFQGGGFYIYRYYLTCPVCSNKRILYSKTKEFKPRKKK